ncbi:MAG: methyltransferase domain-containing protein, partial [Gammaproteobacteria bacterium]|nr:methyltransferase domain-containing protein [Gammaproteobacteria bacterium]NIO61330.1 methyltransferase domain-containing protein [Gammaproteobacteria bacterium]
IAVDLHVMDAESLTFADNSFDTVVSALSTCTFPDPIAALREMNRVCKPTGQILLVEHGRSSLRPLAHYQDRNAHAHYEKSAGCRWNQEPDQLVMAAG